MDRIGTTKNRASRNKSPVPKNNKENLLPTPSPSSSGLRTRGFKNNMRRVPSFNRIINTAGVPVMSLKSTSNHSVNFQQNNDYKQISAVSSMDMSSADAAAGLRRGGDAGGGEMEHFLNSKLDAAHSSTGPPLLLFGFNLSNRFSRKIQFCICAGGVFLFTLLYGYLQELMAVQIFSRDLALFLASIQFFGYTFWAYFLRTVIAVIQKKSGNTSPYKRSGLLLEHNSSGSNGVFSTSKVPLTAYIGISLLRALDLGMTNSAMRYINYPAKTLIKSSRVIFTMLIGVIVSKKKYSKREYFNIFTMFIGLIIFLHADASQAAIFQPLGVLMLITSLTCDGFITNWSETIMRQHNVDQDEYIFRLYSIAFLAITLVAHYRGEMIRGINFMTTPGTVQEILTGTEPTWSVNGKFFVIVMFSTSGFFGSSAAAAITKHFGALPMSITSTARKATTLFLSFALFGNDCSLEHIVGVAVFISALLMKATSKSMKGSEKHPPPHYSFQMTPSISMVDMEMADENQEGKAIV